MCSSYQIDLVVGCVSLSSFAEVARGVAWARQRKWTEWCDVCVACISLFNRAKGGSIMCECVFLLMCWHLECVYGSYFVFIHVDGVEVLHFALLVKH